VENVLNSLPNSTDHHMKKLLILLFILPTLHDQVCAQAPRTVLLEVTESTWDFNTAGVICTKESIKSLYPDEVAVISYHTDNVINGGDPLYNTTSNNWSDALGVNAFARGLIDRVAYNGTSLISVVSDDWSDTIAARLNRTSIGLVTMPEVLYDPTTKEIYARVQIDFKKTVIDLADYRFFCYIVEDGLVADQVVDTNGVVCAVLPDTNDTAVGFVHRDVAISGPGGASGIDNIIPVEVEVDSRYTRAFTYKVPNGKSIENLRVVGFVANWGGETNITRNNVINASKSSDFVSYDSSNEDDPNHPSNPSNPNSINNPNYWPTGVEEHSLDKKLEVYPTPMLDLGILEFSVPGNQMVAVEIFTTDGRLVKQVYRQYLSAGKQKAAISGTHLSRGLYVVRVKGESFEQYGRLLKQ
jgi:hypothetical protein